ncbi:hypothetical protein GCM10027021_15070 [Dyella kyungheensis]|uniref:Transporter n=1 Tax=Dyella kyungheensis TaxID=1242174 RepID=A0ABS2JQW0_9GAMM|nr:hypothetical protein [Dyella kyungheensis]
MQWKVWALWLVTPCLLPGLARAGTGAYLVDDASITPAGQCQVQSWLQVLSGGQQALYTLPACSTGPVEWSLGLAGQSSPYQHQESPAVKWMIVDGEHHALGVAVNVGATWSNGHVTSKNTYAALTWTPNSDSRWALNMDLGEIFAPSKGWRPLFGEGVKYKATDDLAVILEHIRPWNGLSLTQAGVRWSFRKEDSLDLIAGRSDASTHSRWVTVGLNVAL